MLQEEEKHAGARKWSELSWDTLQHIAHFTDTLLKRLRYDAGAAKEFWGEGRPPPRDSKQSIIVFQRQRIVGHPYFSQHKASFGELVIYQETLQKLHDALCAFKMAMHRDPSAAGVQLHANKTFETLMQCLQDSVRDYNRLHENTLLNPSMTLVKSDSPAGKTPTPYERMVVVKSPSGETLSIREAEFLEGQYLISAFLGLCHAEISASKSDAKSELPYAPALEWDAFQRIHKQTSVLETTLIKRYPGSSSGFLGELLHYFNSYFSGDKLEACHSQNDEPIRRIDHGLRYLAVYMKISRNFWTRELLEFDPFIRLNQQEKEARLHQLHHNIKSKMRACVGLQKKYVWLAQTLHHLHVEQERLLSALYREEIHYHALLQIQTLIPPELSEEFAWCRFIKISRPSEAKSLISARREAKSDVPLLPKPLPFSLSDCHVAPLLCDARLFNDDINRIYQLHQSYEAIGIYFDELTDAINALQQRLAHLKEAKNLSHRVSTLAQEAKQRPKSNERTVRAIHLIAQGKQKTCQLVVLPVLQQISKIMGDALQIAPPPEDALEVKSPPVVQPSMPEEKKRQGDVEMNTSILDWEALMYLSRDIYLILSKYSHRIGLEKSMEFRDYMLSVHLKNPSGTPKPEERREAIRLLDDVLRCDDIKKRFGRAVKEEIEIAQGSYLGDHQYFSWDELFRFNVLVRQLQEAYRKSRFGWSSIGILGKDLPAGHEPFFLESYYFTDWFNGPTPNPKRKREGFPDHEQPFHFKHSAAGHRRIHRDLYKLVAGLQDLNISYAVITGNLASGFLADFPEITVCMHAFRSMMASCLREFQEDYALAYEDHQRLLLTCEALKKEYTQLCEYEARRVSTQELRKDLDKKDQKDREKKCSLALSQIGLFIQRVDDRVVKEIEDTIKDAKALAPASVSDRPAKLCADDMKVVSLPAPSQPFPEIPFTLFALLDWHALCKLHNELFTVKYPWQSCVLSKLQKRSYWGFQGVFKEQDRQVLVELMENFRRYFVAGAKREEAQLVQANLIITRLVDRIDHSPNLADFINDFTTLQTRFLDCYDEVVKENLSRAHDLCKKLRSCNATLSEEIDALKARIAAKQSAVFSEARVQADVADAVTSVTPKPGPQESLLAVVGFMADQARRRGAAPEAHAVLDKVASEVSKAFR